MLFIEPLIICDSCRFKAKSKALVLHSDSELDLLFIYTQTSQPTVSVQDNCGASATILLTLTVSPEPRLEPTTTGLLGQHRTSRPAGRSCRLQCNKTNATEIEFVIDKH